MKGINRVTLLGNLGSDPDLRYTQAGDVVAVLSIATGSTRKDKESGEYKEHVEWHRVVLYRSVAEYAGKYLKKGNRVHIDGVLHTQRWQDKTTGQDRYTTEVIGNSLLNLTSTLPNQNGDVDDKAEQPESVTDVPF